MTTVQINGKSIFYRSHDRDADPARPPLVLVHGAGGTLAHWPSALRRLPGTAVYALDLPGHGKSGGAACTAIEAYGAVVEHFIDALDLPPVVLAGHSMGGAIAQQVALHAPHKLAGLGLVATGARLPVAPQILDGIHSAFVDTIHLIAEWVYGPTVGPGLRADYVADLQRAGAAVLHDDFSACNAFDRRGQLGGIALPTLIVCGHADRMTPPKFSRSLHEELSNSALHLIDDAGHMVMLERTDQVAARFQDFLAGIAPLTPQ